MLLPDAPLGVTAPMLQGGIALKAPFEVELFSRPVVVHARSILEYIVRTILLIILDCYSLGHFRHGPTARDGGTTPRADWGLY
jgi:hypothetical protein